MDPKVDFWFLKERKISNDGKIRRRFTVFPNAERMAQNKQNKCLLPAFLLI